MCAVGGISRAGNFLAVSGARAKASLEVPGPIWSARANPMNGARANLEVPGPVWDARASLGCQRQIGMPVQVWGANANLECQRQCQVPGPM